MTAKGCGTVAAKILQANAKTFSKDVRDNTLSHSDDEDYIPNDYEVDNNEEITSSKFTMKQSTKKRSCSTRGCMSAFLSPSSQQHEQLKQVKVAQIRNRKKHQEGVEQEQHHQEHHQELSVQQPLLQQPMQQKGDIEPLHEEHIEQEAEENRIVVQAPKKKKHRGPTKLVEAHARIMHERPVVVLNALGQPIGPTKKISNEYSRFLGTVARNPEYAPLNNCEWSSLPTHEKCGSMSKRSMWYTMLAKLGC